MTAAIRFTPWAWSLCEHSTAFATSAFLRCAGASRLKTIRPKKPEEPKHCSWDAYLPVQSEKEIDQKVHQLAKKYKKIPKVSPTDLLPHFTKPTKV